MSHFRFSTVRGKWLLEAPCMSDRKERKANVALNLRCGVPARPTVFCYLFGPEQLLVTKPKLGDRWRGEFGNDMRKKVIIDDALWGESVVAADDESITVPAGRFRNCLKIETTIRATDRALQACKREGWTLRQLSGKRWMWFAPGVGLIRVLNMDLNDQLTDIVLVDGQQQDNTGAYLPLAVGNWWRYEWIESLYPRAILKETCRVVKRSEQGAMVSCGLHSRKLEEPARHEHQERTTEFLRHSSEDHLVAKALVDRAGSDPGRLRRAEKRLAQMAELGFRADVLFRLAWQYEQAAQPAKALHAWEQVLQALSAPAGATQRVHLSFDIAGACFRLNDYAKMLEVASQTEPIFRELGEKRDQASMAGLAEVGAWLCKEGQAHNIGGYADGWVEVTPGPSVLEGGNRASGSCVPFLRKTPGFEPICLGIERLLLLPVRVGRHWTDSWNSGSPRGSVCPVVTRTIEARHDTVDLSAARFKECLRVRAEIRTPPGVGGGKADREWRGNNDGVRLDWYAPGVGLVKVEFRHANGKVTRIRLVDYKVQAARESYLPCRVGNTWQYEWRDGRGKLLFREFWRVAAREGKTVYIGHGAVELV